MIKNIIMKIQAVFLGLLLAFLAAVPAAAAVVPGASFGVDSDYWDYWPEAEWISGSTACLMDANTGTILYSKGLDAPRFPASITKVMTALVVVENCGMDEQVVMTETGLADAYSGSSNVIPTLGEVFTVEQCLQMLLVKSANDIASQLAEHTAGSVAAFADMMNARAAELGCRNTHFTNASGLEDDNHYTTARDMALIMQAAIQKDKIREIMAMQGVEIPATNTSGARYYSTHVYLTQPDNRFYYEGCLGGKTGYTDISRSTLVCYAQRGDMVLIGVVMDSPETESNAGDMITLFNYGFNNFHRENAVNGYECIEGGAVTLPDGVDSSMLTLDAVPDGENTEITFYIADHRIGSCTMTAENYQKLQVSRGELSPEETEPSSEKPAETSSASEKEDESAERSASGSSGTSAEPAEKTEEKKTEQKPVLYIVMIILGAAILLCLLFLSVRAKKIRKKKRRQAGNERSGKKK